MSSNIPCASEHVISVSTGNISYKSVFSVPVPVLAKSKTNYVKAVTPTPHQTSTTTSAPLNVTLPSKSMTGLKATAYTMCHSSPTATSDSSDILCNNAAPQIAEKSSNQIHQIKIFAVKNNDETLRFYKKKCPLKKSHTCDVITSKNNKTKVLQPFTRHVKKLKIIHPHRETKNFINSLSSGLNSADLVEHCIDMQRDGMISSIHDKSEECQDEYRNCLPGIELHDFSKCATVAKRENCFNMEYSELEVKPSSLIFMKNSDVQEPLLSFASANTEAPVVQSLPVKLNKSIVLFVSTGNSTKEEYLDGIDKSLLRMQSTNTVETHYSSKSSAARKHLLQQPVTSVKHKKMQPLKLSSQPCAEYTDSLTTNQSWISARSSKCSAYSNNDSSSYTTGMWQADEIEQLTQNVTQYCESHGLNDPSLVIFGMSKSERSGFYRDIAKGINRPLFSIYRKVIRKYDVRNYLGRYNSEELKQLRNLYSVHGNNWQLIASALGRSSASVKDRCRLLAKGSGNSGAWSCLEEERLAAAVQKQSTGGSSIVWSTVSAAVGTRTDKQCRAKWLNYLSWKRTSGVTWSKADDLQLICRLSVCGVVQESSVDWAALARGWPAARSPSWLRCKWWSLKQRHMGCRQATLRDHCRLLYNSSPASVLRSAIIKMPTTNPDGDGPTLRLCIPASNFADLINIDSSSDDVQARLQKLIESAVVIAEDQNTSSAAGDDTRAMMASPMQLPCDGTGSEHLTYASLSDDASGEEVFAIDGEVCLTGSEACTHTHHVLADTSPGAVVTLRSHDDTGQDGASEGMAAEEDDSTGGSGSYHDSGLCLAPLRGTTPTLLHAGEDPVLTVTEELLEQERTTPSTSSH